MTFAIVLANADQIIQVNDRRITIGKKIDNDSANKGGHAICDDASFLYCFSGLATVDARHVTSRWLPNALYDAAQSGHRYENIVTALAKEAGKFFASSPILKILSAYDRRLTIMITGYTADGHIVNSIISNFQDFENSFDHPTAQQEFLCHMIYSEKLATENPTLIRAIGQFHTLTAKDKLPLQNMLTNRAPAKAIRQKAITLVQAVSDRPNTNGTVGKKVTTSRLDRLDPLVPIVSYASDEMEQHIPLLNQVILTSGAPKILISDARISTLAPIVFPARHRNAPCPCGSGKKIRFCHRV